MFSAIYIAAATLGLFFLLAGWNKLFNSTRRTQMQNTMERLFGPRLGPFLWGFVSTAEFGGGIWLILAPMVGWYGLAIFAALVLAIISLAALWMVDRHAMHTRWQPNCCSDKISCYLYLPQVLYVALASIVIVGYA